MIASRLPGSEVGEQMISKPASRMALLSPTSSVAEPRAGSVALVSTRTLSWGIRENRYSWGYRGERSKELEIVAIAQGSDMQNYHFPNSPRD